ncbi:MAG: hypothetical protein ACKVKF_26705 [Rhodobacterales bacterium]
MPAVPGGAAAGPGGAAAAGPGGAAAGAGRAAGRGVEGARADRGHGGWGEASWMSMPAAAQEEVDEAVAMLAEAAAQGRTEVQEFRGTPMHSTLLLCHATLLPVHPSFTLS